jgi:hypothetical protein
MGDYLCMSFIIRTFVLSVVNTDDGFGGCPSQRVDSTAPYNIYKA